MEYGRVQPWDTRGAHFFSIMMVGLVVAASFNYEKTTTNVAALDRMNCQEWDQKAADGITHLIYDSSAAAESKLAEAVAQLHRARVSCRAGSIAMARNDYA